LEIEWEFDMTCALATLWKVIVEELSQQETQLASNPFGKFVARTCAISVWKHQKDEWKKVVTQTERDLELFKDILGGEPASNFYNDYAVPSSSLRRQ
jgi:hypothetical protein